MSKKGGINRETDVSGEIQIGPTSLGMVRLYVQAGEMDLPMDFTPEEARDIAEELVNAAEEAEQMHGKPAKSGKGGKPAKR